MPYHRCADCGLTSYSAAAHASASVCPTCTAPLSDTTRVYVAPGATRTINRELVARPEAGAEARGEIDALPISQEAREQLALLVSELVNNAVLHADAAPESRVSLKVSLRPGRVRVEVGDSGSGFDASAPISPDPLAVGGQGLVIVAALSDAWGVLRGSNGCTVWCEVLVAESADAVDHEVTGAYVRELATELATPAPGGECAMNEYRCPRCDARAYSSANPETVGACPRCAAPLATPPRRSLAASCGRLAAEAAHR